MIVILSEGEHLYGAHRASIYEASLVFAKAPKGYIKVKDRLKGCGFKSDVYTEEGLNASIKEHEVLYDAVYLKELKETQNDSNEC